MNFRAQPPAGERRGLPQFRAEIDELDNQLVRILARRFAVCRDVAEFKARTSVPMMQPQRVAAVKDRAVARADCYGLPREVVTNLYDSMVGAICEMEDEIIADRLAQPPSPPPIFVGGDDRSGTTLVSVILDSHPELSFGPELDDHLPVDLGPHLRECLRLLLADDLRVRGPGVQTADPAYGLGVQFARQVRRFGVDHHVLDQLVAETMQRTGSDLVSADQRLALIEAVGKQRCADTGSGGWGIKIQRRIATPDAYLDRWPEARFIHVVRDGRDVAASQLRGNRDWGYRSIAAAAAGWQEVVTAVPMAVPPGQLFPLRYEDLVAAPETVLRDLLNFLKLDWHPDLLRHAETEHALFAEPFAHPSIDSVRQPIQSVAVGRYRHDLSPTERREFEAIAGDTLRRYGYLHGLPRSWDLGQPRILIIDNYDSFTYNLVHQLGRVTGAEPLVVRNDHVSIDEIRVLDPDAIVISPGPGSPDIATDVGISAAVLTELGNTPVLGVCLGFQALVRAADGGVGRTGPMHGRASAIRHHDCDLFAGLPQDFAAIRYHSLAATGSLPDNLELTAWTEDGVPMGIRHLERPIWAVQFHPESICTEYGDQIVANFLTLAGRVRPATPATPAWSQAVETTRASTRPEPAADPPRQLGNPNLRRLSTWCEPEDAFVSLYADATHAFWLDSSLNGPGVARYSIIGAERPGGTAISYDAAHGEVTIRRGDRIERRTIGVLELLREELARIQVAPVGEVPFAGGFVGYLGYEVGQDCDGNNHAGPGNSLSSRSRASATASPDAYWMLADRVLIFDHQLREVWAVTLPTTEPAAAGRAEAAESAAWLDVIEHAVSNMQPAPPPEPATASPDDPVSLRLDRDADSYLADIDACQEAIRAGESYELCLTAQATTAPVARPLDLYRVLRRVSPAPYASYLRLGEVAVLSSSPECFLKLDSARTVSSRPMKGTAARHPDPVLDAELRDQLGGGVKDRAENLMIVDLLRNDLGRVSELDSISVPALMSVETYATVHQLTSTITGKLPAGTGIIDCIAASFPGGSMTGAPKLRSMEILARLERGPRGIYSGSLGYLSADGRAELNIVIRTAICTPTATTIGVGGAITALSEPSAEFDEIVLKTQGIVRAILAWRGQPYDPQLIQLTGPSGLPTRNSVELSPAAADRSTKSA